MLGYFDHSVFIITPSILHNQSPVYPYFFLYMINRSNVSVFLLCISYCGSVQAIVMSHSGEVNLSIPADFDGVYLDFTDFGDASVYSTSYSKPANAIVPSDPVLWDINPFFGGAALAASDTFEVVSISDTTNSDIMKLMFETTVGPSLGSGGFSSGYSGSTGHMDNGGDPVDSVKFENGSSGYIGFALYDEPNSDHYYGWMRMSLSDDSTTGTIHEWAWNTIANEAVTVGAVPEPKNAALLLGMSTILWVGARRRTSSR